jgi:hypothetical protein
MDQLLAKPQGSPSPETPRVSVADAAPVSERLRGVLEAYARALEAPFALHLPPQHHRAPQPALALHVHCYAMPRRPFLFGVWPRVPIVRLPLAFGYPLPASGASGFAPRQGFWRGRVLADAEGQAMVEVTGANVYVLWDLPAQGDLAPLLLRRCLDLGLAACPALARLSPLPAAAQAGALAALARETAETEAAWQARRREEGRLRFQAACSDRLLDEARRLEREIDDAERTLEECGRRITAETRALAERHRRLRTLRGLAPEPAGTLREFDRIRDLPEVRQVDVADGGIALITRPLEARCDGHRYRLGAFRVDILFEGEVRITNLTDPRGLYDHPHVRQARPCLGNVREGVAKLIGEFEFAAAAQVLVDFLKTVNPQDWRIPVFYWPRADA